MRGSHHASLSRRVADTLEGKISQGRWSGSLPGIRVLCDEAGVSSRTMMMALRILENRGLLAPAQKGKPRELVDGVQREDTVKKFSVCIVTWQPLECLSRADQDVVIHFREEVYRAGGRVHTVVFRDLVNPCGAAHIKEVIEQNPADGYLVMGAHRKCSEVLRGVEAEVVYVGGEHVSGAVPRVSYSLRAVCGDFLSRLKEMGHQRCVVLLPLAMIDECEGLSAGEVAMKRAYEALDLDFMASYHCPRWGSELADLQGTLDRLFRLTPPSALILGDACLVPGVVSFLMRKGLKYPDDVSLVCLDDARWLDDFSPPVSRTSKPGKVAAKRVMRLLETLMEKTGKVEDVTTFIASSVRMTGSMAPPSGN